MPDRRPAAGGPRAYDNLSGLLAGATGRTPLADAPGKSGAILERVVIGGQGYVLKPGLVWPGLLAAGCVILFCASAAVAMALNPRRARRPVAV